MSAARLEELDSRYYDVVIVGGGLAGLAAANELRKKASSVLGGSVAKKSKNVSGRKTDDCPLNVLVVEAGSYVGGRVKTVQAFGKSPRQSIEVGAEIIHGENTSLWKLTEEHQLPITDVYTWAQGDGGPFPDRPVKGGVGYYYLGGEKKLLRFDSKRRDFREVNELLGELCEIDVALVGESASKTTLLDYLRGRRVPRQMISLAEAGYANTQCNNLRNMGLVNTVAMEKSWLHDGSKEARLSDSLQSVVCALRGSQPVWTNWPVSRIDWMPEEDETVMYERLHDRNSTHNHNAMIISKIRALYAARRQMGKRQEYPVRVWSGSESIRARAVIVAVPVPVLQDEDIAFRPGLPSWKLDAAMRMHVEPSVKIAIKFSREFWPSDLHGIICADCVFPEFWPAVHSSSECGILIAFACAHYARRISKLTRSGLIYTLLEQLDEIFGTEDDKTPASDYFIDVHVQDWGEEPYIRGGYVSPSIDSHPEDWRHVERPLSGQLFFAGEALNEGGCTMHSAIDSGRRSALDVLHALKRGFPEEFEQQRSRL